VRLEGPTNWRERYAGVPLHALPHDVSGHTWHHPDDVLFRITKHGVAKVAKMKDHTTAMPVYEGTLSDEVTRRSSPWIKAQWSPDIREMQEKIDRAYRTSRP
jgi:hypothetical protein